jgi:hypothetical protein
MPKRVSAIPALVWIIGAVLVIIIIFTGYRAVQTQHRLQTVQSELVSAKDQAAQTKARVADFEKRADSLNTHFRPRSSVGLWQTPHALCSPKNNVKQSSAICAIIRESNAPSLLTSTSKA